MVARAIKTTRAGLRYTFAYRRNDLGFLINFDGTTPANGDQNGTGGGVAMEMPQSFPVDIPDTDEVVIESETVDVRFDNILGPGKSLRFDTTIGTFDLEHQAYMQGTSVVNVGANSVGIGMPDTPEVPNVMLLEQNWAKSHDSGGSFGQRLVNGMFLLNCNLSWQGADTMDQSTPQNNQWTVTCDQYDYDYRGQTFTDATYGTCQAVFQPVHSPYFLDIVAYRGNAVAAQFFLARQLVTGAVAGTNIEVVVDRTIQTPAVDYTIDVATNSFTFQAGSIPAANAVIETWYHWSQVCA